jgi:hypothetical protein
MEILICLSATMLTLTVITLLFALLVVDADLARETKSPLRLLVEENIVTLRPGGVPPTEKDYAYNLATVMNVFLAAKHINERRSDILPVLALEGCNRNVSIINFSIDSAVPAKAMFAISSFADEIDAIIGMGLSSVAVHAAILGTVYSKPIVSYWATSPILSDKRGYPFFARSVSSDQTVAEKIVKLLKQWGYSKFALFYLDVSTPYKWL